MSGNPPRPLPQSGASGQLGLRNDVSRTSPGNVIRRVRVIHETPCGSQLVAVELTDEAKRALSVGPTLHREVLPARRRRNARSAHLVLALLACASLLGIGQIYARGSRAGELQQRLDELESSFFDLRADVGWHLREPGSP